MTNSRRMVLLSSEVGEEGRTGDGLKVEPEREEAVCPDVLIKSLTTPRNSVPGTRGFI